LFRRSVFHPQQNADFRLLDRVHLERTIEPELGVYAEHTAPLHCKQLVSRSFELRMVIHKAEVDRQALWVPAHAHAAKSQLLIQKVWQCPRRVLQLLAEIFLGDDDVLSMAAWYLLGAFLVVVFLALTLMRSNAPSWTTLLFSGAFIS